MSELLVSTQLGINMVFNVITAIISRCDITLSLIQLEFWCLIA